MAQLQDDSGLDQEMGNKWMDSNTAQEVDPQDLNVEGSKEQGRRTGQECVPHFLLCICLGQQWRHLLGQVAFAKEGQLIVKMGRQWLSLQGQRSATVNTQPGTQEMAQFLHFRVCTVPCIISRCFSIALGGKRTIGFITHL